MRKAIDYQLAERANHAPARALDPPVLTALRMGAFQLLYLDRLPPSAVVNDAVALTKRGGKGSAGGLVNAVLRALAREPRPPDVAGRSTGDGARDASFTSGMARRTLAGRYGLEAAAAWLAFNNHAPRLCLAINRLKATREALAARLARQASRHEQPARAPHGLHVVTKRAALSTAAFRDGWFVVQDEASQLDRGTRELRRDSAFSTLCVTWRQDDDTGGAPGRRRPVCRVRCAAAPRPPAAADAERVCRCPPRSSRYRGCYLPFAAGHVRFRLGRRALLGARHAPSRPGHPMGAHAGRSRAACRRAVDPAASCGAAREPRPARWFTPPARASPRKTRRSWRRSSLMRRASRCARHTQSTPIADGLEAFYGAVLERRV